MEDDGLRGGGRSMSYSKSTSWLKSPHVAIDGAQRLWWQEPTAIAGTPLDALQISPKAGHNSKLTRGA